MGVMNSLRGSLRSVSIMDQFFLGGPLTLRGFNIKGVGPHEDGLSTRSYSSLELCFYDNNNNNNNARFIQCHIVQTNQRHCPQPATLIMNVTE